MSSDISPDNEQFIQHAIAAGTFRDRGELFDEAVRLLRQRERRRERLREDIQAGIESETISSDEAFAELERTAQEISSKHK